MGISIYSTGEIKNSALPCFNVYSNQNQTLTSAVWTKIQLNTALFDTNSNFNTTTYRFTPSVAGYYHFDCGVAALVGSNQALMASIYKNGNEAAKAFNYSNTVNLLDDWSVNLSTLLYMNGSTDYIELYAYVVGSNLTVNYSSGWTWLSGHFVRAA